MTKNPATRRPLWGFGCGGLGFPIWDPWSFFVLEMYGHVSIICWIVVCVYQYVCTYVYIYTHTHIGIHGHSDVQNQPLQDHVNRMNSWNRCKHLKYPKCLYTILHGAFWSFQLDVGIKRNPSKKMRMLTIWSFHYSVALIHLADQATKDSSQDLFFLNDWFDRFFSADSFLEDSVQTDQLQVQLSHHDEFKFWLTFSQSWLVRAPWTNLMDITFAEVLSTFVVKNINVCVARGRKTSTCVWPGTKFMKTWGMPSNCYVFFLGTFNVCSRDPI